MSHAMDIDEFLSHSTQSARGAYLSGWKKRAPLAGTKPPQPGVNTVLMRNDAIYSLARHNIPRMVVDEESNDKKVFPGAHVCWEDEKKVIKFQFKRLEDGTRAVPPKTCGICKLIEWIYQSIIQGGDDGLSWVEPVFQFDDEENDERTITLYAGGLCGLFGKKDMTPDEKKQLKKHGIFLTQAFQQNMVTKINYLFTVVDYDAPATGPQIAIESSLLGDKVKGVIMDRRASLGVEEGDPSKNPFVIQWLYNAADGISFDKKYHARAIDPKSMPITDEIDAIISGDPVDVDHITRPHNALEIRTYLEEHFVGNFKMPWDEFFGEAAEPEEEAPAKPAGKAATKTPAKPAGKTSTESRLSVGKPAGKKAAAEPEPEEPEEEEDRATSAADDIGPDDDLDCDACGKPVKGRDKRCRHCGAVFVVEADPEPEPEPEPPPRRRRAAASVPPPPAGRQAAPATRATLPQGAGKPTGKPTGKGAFPNDKGDVPFIFCDVAREGERWWRWE